MIGAFAMLALTGCASVRVHDPSKSELATSIKTKYESADILGTIDTERENLAALNAEEMKVVRSNLELQRDYAMLEIVDNDSAMGVTWNEAAVRNSRSSREKTERALCSRPSR